MAGLHRISDTLLTEDATTEDFSAVQTWLQLGACVFSSPRTGVFYVCGEQLASMHMLGRVVWRAGTAI